MPSRTFSLAFYNALLPLGLCCMAPGALIKMRRRGGNWRDFGQRLGLWNNERAQALAALPKPDLIWMHAVSVGEVGVARKLIAELLKQQPQRAIVLTVTTPTGQRLALEIEQAYPQRVVALFSPLDLSSVAKRVLDTLKPAQIVLVEAEVWPNILAQATKRGIPVTLVNARLSHRSERRYQQARGFIAPIFGMLSRVCVQEPEDVDRWAGLGVDRSGITLTGSIKYDPQGSAAAPGQVQSLGTILQHLGLLGRPLLLAASTHPGEEVALARVYQALRPQHPTLGLLIVPRHYERGSDVVAELQALGLQPQQRSRLDGVSQVADVLVIDSTGELKAWQEHASIVVIGKSFLAEGGQNPAEAVVAGKPVVFGPHMENFEPLVKLLLDAGGAMQVTDVQALQHGLQTLLADPTLCAALAQAGQRALMKHQGATARTAVLLASI